MSRNNHSDDRGKRTLEPIHTRGYKHIPHLRDKLPWLFGLHPFIKRNYELARELHVSPATLSTWLNGVRFSDARTIAPANPDSIPIEHFRSFVDLWGLPADVLDLEDLDEFRRTIEHFELGRGAWERLVRAVPDDTRIEIIVEDATRGLVDPDEEEELGIPHFNVGARIMLRVSSAGLRHGAMLEQDRSGWLSLRPNPRWTETDVDGQMIFPRQHADGPPRFARLEGPGLHRLLAVFTVAGRRSGDSDGPADRTGPAQLHRDGHPKQAGGRPRQMPAGEPSLPGRDPGGLRRDARARGQRRVRRAWIAGATGCSGRPG